MVDPTDIYIDVGSDHSAEENEVIENDAEIVNNTVLTFRLQSTDMPKGKHVTRMNGYVENVIQYLQKNEPKRVKGFKKEVADLEKAMANFKDYKFYTSECMDPNCMATLKAKREDGVTPYLISRGGRVPEALDERTLGKGLPPVFWFSLHALTAQR
ncbi:hypothetical protein IW140_001456 [Coemansia sp. RSA 1813]|nr:hypothetical protein IW140_001456 [Coemansia sp. RSA 1813]